MSEVLLLNANFEPLNVCHMTRALSLVLLGKADVIVGTELVVVTGQTNLPAPSIVKMRYFVRRPINQLRLSRQSVLARDNFTCQYCGSRKDLTIDHVTPRWCGGPHTWDNLVACCRKCNLKKGDKTPAQANMTLARPPRRPHFVPFLSLPKYMKAMQRDDWHDYLPYYEEFAQSRAAYAC